MNRREIILHCFQWKLVDIILQLQEIKDSGYTAIQISPIQPTKDNGNEWWKLYQPLGFMIGNSQIGTKADLILLCEKAHACGLKIIADVILDHVADDNTGRLIPHPLVDKELLDNKFFWKQRTNINDWNNRNEVVSYCYGLPVLQLNNYDLQDIIIRFLNELIDCGVSGFRIDSGKSIALPEEGSDFWTRVFKHLKNKELFNYAEVIFVDKLLIDKYCNYINVATNSFGSDKRKLIVYIESHDSYLEFGWTKKMTDEQLINEWKVLIDNKEWSVLFYTRPFSDLWKDQRIKQINTNY